MSNYPLGTWRYRLNLTSTVKDGYRVGDATIEFTELAPGQGTYDDMSEEYKIRLEQLIEDGEKVATRMNKQNAIATTTTVTAPRNHQEGTIK